MFLGINIFPSDVYYLEKMPSEINFVSVSVVFLLSLVIIELATLNLEYGLYEFSNNLKVFLIFCSIINIEYLKL